MNFLHAAYAATWIIHLVYVVTLVTRYGRVKKDLDELKRN